MSDGSRIIKNTLVLYFRQILIMAVSLYTVRGVLNELGAEDYGIYNIVAGVITMFGFLGAAMATASQRYFSFDLGKGNFEHLKITFSITCQIYFLLALIVVLFAETIGLWFVNHKLVIPAQRMIAANWIFQVAIISFVLLLITTPYMAAIIAHENMNVYTYVSIVEVCLKFCTVFLLRVLQYDKLIVYGVLLAIVALINTSLYRFFCRKYYTECRVRFIRNRALFKEIVSYSGWNLFGGCVGVFKNQLINILLNINFGAIVNAARGVASQVNGAVGSFSHNFSTAIRPQIIKTYAIQKNEETLSLVFRGCKFTFFLMYFFSMPLALEMKMVLKLWLKNPPEYAVLFTQLALLDAVIDSISFPIMTLAQATGKIKLYQGVVGGILLLNLPFAWLALNFFHTPYSVAVVAICITFIAFFVRLFVVKNITNFPLIGFFIKVFMPCLLVAIVSPIATLIYKYFAKENLISFFISTSISFFSTVFFVYVIGMKKNERNLVLAFIKQKCGGAR